uniref:Site-specific integrase n=1 Tax=Muribaculaceae bacterium Z82 TaxID=2304548 RepID=A0A7C9JDW1_9BACT
MIRIGKTRVEPCGEGVWLVTVNYTDESKQGRARYGQSVRRVAGSREHALALAADVAAELGACGRPEARVERLDKGLHDFIRENTAARAAMKGLARDTLRHERLFAQVLLDHMPDKPVADVVPADVCALIGELLQAGKSVDRCIRVRKFLKAAFEDAIELRLCESNPVTRQSKIVPDRVSTASRRHSLSRDALVRLCYILSMCDGANAKVVCARLIAKTGIRRGEALALNWEDVLFDRLELAVFFSVDEGGVRGPTKTPKSERRIRVEQDVVDLLSAWRRAQRRMLFSLGIRQTERTPVFTTSKGTRVGPTTMTHWFERWCALYGFGQFFDADGDPVVDYAGQKPEKGWRYEGLRLHELRHTSVTLLLAEGEDLVTVQNRHGHAQGSTTLDMYAHAIPAKDESAAIIMARLTSTSGYDPASDPGFPKIPEFGLCPK